MNRTGSLLQNHLTGLAALPIALLAAALAFLPLRPAAGADDQRRAAPLFRRGDANQDEGVNIADALSILGSIYLGKSGAECRDSFDVNDDGRVDITDPVALLGWSFQGGDAPAAPGPDRCGRDPTPDSLPDCVYSVLACGAGQPPSGRLVLTGIEPREVEETDAPLLLAIAGSGFEKGIVARLFYPDEKTLSMDLQPDSVESDRAVVRVGADWFKRLASLPAAGPAGAAARAKPDAFFVKVLHPDGSSSEPGLVGIRSFALRLTRVATKELVLGGANALDVDIEWRTFTASVELEVRAFEAPPDIETIQEPTAFRLEGVPGIRGAVAVEAGTERASIPVKLARSLRPGKYLVDVAAKPLAVAALPQQALSVATSLVTVVEADAARRLALKNKTPPMPGPTPPPPDPGRPPNPFELDVFVKEQTADHVILRWKNPPDATSHWLEESVGGSAESQWWHVATFDGNDSVNGWVEYQHVPRYDCAMAYRLGAENNIGDSRGGVTRIQGTPILTEPPILHDARAHDWGVRLRWYAYAPAEGVTRFNFLVRDGSATTTAYDHGDAVPFNAVPGQWGLYYFDVAWWYLWEAQDGPVPASLCFNIILDNDGCNSLAAEEALCFSTEPGSSSDPPDDPPDSPPPPPAPKPDLRFATNPGIYLGDCHCDHPGVVNWPEPNQPVGIFWDVWNASTVTTAGFTDTLAVDGSAFWNYPGGGLSPNDWAKEWLWLPYGFSAGNHSLEVHLDQLNEVHEVSEVNNVQYRGIDVGW